MNQNTTTIHTEGGLAHSGPINTDGGDFVARDKIIYNNYPRLDPADSRNQRNHAVLRQAVRRFWVDSVLKSSLYNEMLIRLGLDMEPEAVDNNRPWDLILKQPGLPDEAIDDDKEIATIFDEMNQLLLILGEPGAGKTTTLLTLADTLLHRADADPTLPTAVVFNLSSWAEKELPLGEWLVDELCTRYRMPKKVSQSWVANDELILLLDGLDEVAADKRATCVQAINDFRQEHIVGMVVCSRTAEYSALTEQLRLEGAVAVRPLTMAQVDEYVAQAGASLAGLGDALAQSQELRELAQTPLMLSVMVLAYHDQDSQSKVASNSDRNERQRLFDGYIQRMFQHRELIHLYPPIQTVQWLRWLAGQMIEWDQTIFRIEGLQPKWLGIETRIHSYQRMLGLIIGLSFGLIVGLSLVLAIGNQDNFLMTMSISLLIVLFVSPIVGMVAINYFGFEIKISEILNFSPRNALIIGSFGFSFGWFSILALILSLDTEITLSLWFWLVIGLISGLRGGFYNLKPWKDIKYILLLWGITTSLSIFLSLIGSMFWPLWLVLHFTVITLLLKEKRLMANDLPAQPNQAIWILFMRGTIIGLGFSLISGWAFGQFSIIVGLIVGLMGGLKECFMHFALRWLFYRKNYIPWNYARFLDYAAARLFLRKVGGGYVFVHRMIMEHFASLSDEDIGRIVRGLKS